MKAKSIILPLLIVAIGQGVFGQGKSTLTVITNCDTCKINGVLYKDFKFPEIVNGGTIRKDTVAVYFKELIINSGGVSEQWVSGYACREIWRSIDPYFYNPPLKEIPTIQGYLYVNKQRVKNTVIYSVNKSN